MEKLVMIPGPTPVARSIQDQMGREIQAFGDPRFVADFRDIIDSLGKIVNCSGKAFVVAGTGTLAMEMAISNLTGKGDSILIVSHGFFGDRFVEIGQRKGLNVDVLTCDWGEIVPLDKIEEKLSEKQYAAITVTHVDTSTGVCAPIKAIGDVVKKYPDTLYIVDGVCATGAELEDFDQMGMDILFTGTQKAFGVCPGLLMLWASEKAVEKRNSLGSIPEYYVDFQKWLPIMDDPSKYFATPAINLIWALKESIRLIEEEGIQDRYQRHKKNAVAVQKAMNTLGFSILANPKYRAVTLSNLIYPDGIVDQDFRAKLYDEGIVVAGGLGAYAGRMFRLGHMGNINIGHMLTAIAAIERTMHYFGKLPQPGLALGTYLSEMLA
jgi:aspartate aminotransferase-like enzyme